MTEKRFADVTSAEEIAAPGFLLVAVSSAPGQVSPLQVLYQQMYEQAVQANQPSRLRDLFAILN